MAVPGSANSLGRRRRQSREYLMTTHKVGYLIGSLAKGSLNRKLAKALVRLAPSELQLTEISFKDLPHYSYASDSAFPPAARAFKDALTAVMHVLFFPPDFHRSLPRCLQNGL